MMSESSPHCGKGPDPQGAGPHRELLRSSRARPGAGASCGPGGAGHPRVRPRSTAEFQGLRPTSRWD